MKFTSYILSLIIIIMVAIPCNDAIYTNNNETNITQIKHSVSDHSQHQQDDCSPVCSCNCCGTLLTLTTIQKFQNIEKSVFFKHNFNYHFHYSQKYTNGVWHPPILS